MEVTIGIEGGGMNNTLAVLQTNIEYIAKFVGVQEIYVYAAGILLVLVLLFLLFRFVEHFSKAIILIIILWIVASVFGLV